MQIITYFYFRSSSSANICIPETKERNICIAEFLCVGLHFFFIEGFAPSDFLIVYNMGVSLFFFLSAGIFF